MAHPLTDPFDPRSDLKRIVGSLIDVAAALKHSEGIVVDLISPADKPAARATQVTALGVELTETYADLAEHAEHAEKGLTPEKFLRTDKSVGFSRSIPRGVSESSAASVHATSADMAVMKNVICSVPNLCATAASIRAGMI